MRRVILNENEKGKTDFHNTYSEGWGGKYSSGCLEYLEDKQIIFMMSTLPRKVQQFIGKGFNINTMASKSIRTLTSDLTL